jgi:hypothetical protein
LLLWTFVVCTAWIAETVFHPVKRHVATQASSFDACKQRLRSESTGYVPSRVVGDASTVIGTIRYAASKSSGLQSKPIPCEAGHRTMAPRPRRLAGLEHMAHHEGGRRKAAARRVSGDIVLSPLQAGERTDGVEYV